ncbi:MAG: alpha/beta hydrolase-fold protein [Bryobacteraceae bacterium]
MNREYHKWKSGELYRDMEMLTYGHAGYPVLVFPTSKGRFFEFEDRGMIDALAGKIDAGQIRVFCVDSVDAESWYNYGTHPKWRAVRHVQYDNYIRNEVVPYIRWVAGGNALTAAGASFGAYHALNFTLRHPELVTYCLAMSGAYDIHSFVSGYYDENCYFNCPVDFMPNVSDNGILQRLRTGTRIVLAAGDWDICLGHTQRMSDILNSKGVPNELSIWQGHWKHDWPLWQQMVRTFL